MKDYEAGRCWESNAAAWTRLVRAGWDIFRDYINTPAFFEMLPPVAGLRGLDIGCFDFASLLRYAAPPQSARRERTRGGDRNRRLLDKTMVWIAEWLFSAAPPDAKAGLPKFRTPRFHWTLAEWLNMIAASGMNVEQAAANTN